MRAYACEPLRVASPVGIRSLPRLRRFRPRRRGNHPPLSLSAATVRFRAGMHSCCPNVVANCGTLAWITQVWPIVRCRGCGSQPRARPVSPASTAPLSSGPSRPLRSTGSITTSPRLACWSCGMGDFPMISTSRQPTACWRRGISGCSPPPRSLRAQVRTTVHPRQIGPVQPFGSAQGLWPGAGGRSAPAGRRHHRRALSDTEFVGIADDALLIGFPDTAASNASSLVTAACAAVAADRS